MALYVGEAVRISAEALDPDGRSPLDPPPLSAHVEFWAPGRNPVRDPDVRGTPDVAAQPLTRDDVTGVWALYQSTDGAPWVAGKWTYRVTVVGSAYENWEYASFSLKL